MLITIDTIKLQELSPCAVIALGAITQRMKLSERNNWKNEKGTYCTMKYKELAELLEITERHARRILRELENEGYIIRERASSNTTLIYLSDPESDPKDVGQVCPTVKDKNVLRKGQKCPTKRTKMSYDHRINNKDKELISSSSEKREDEEEEHKDIKTLIKKLAAEMGYTLREKEIIYIENSIARRKTAIANLQNYIRVCIENEIFKASAKSMSYEATYDIEEYENMSIIDKGRGGGSNDQ